MRKLEQVIGSIKLDHTAVEKLNLNLISAPPPSPQGDLSFNVSAQVFRQEEADPNKLSMFKVVVTTKIEGRTTPDKKEADIFTIDLIYAGFYVTLDGKTLRYADVKEASALIGNQLTPLIYHMINDLLFKMGLRTDKFSLDMFHLKSPAPTAKKKAAKKKKK